MTNLEGDIIDRSNYKTVLPGIVEREKRSKVIDCKIECLIMFMFP